MKYQINYVYYYDLPMQQGMMCEQHRVHEKLYDTKELAESAAKDYNRQNVRSGKYVVKPVKNGKQ